MLGIHWGPAAAGEVGAAPREGGCCCVAAECRAGFWPVSPISSTLLPSWWRPSHSSVDAVFSLCCRDFSWSPGGNIIAFWVPEDKDIPARVTLMQLPTRQEIRVRNLFNVVDCKLHWQKNGDYLCVKVDRTPKGTQVSGYPRAEAPPSSSTPTSCLKGVSGLFAPVAGLQPHWLLGTVTGPCSLCHILNWRVFSSSRKACIRQHLSAPTPGLPTPAAPPSSHTEVSRHLVGMKACIMRPGLPHRACFQGSRALWHVSAPHSGSVLSGALLGGCAGPLTRACGWTRLSSAPSGCPG